MLWVKMASCPQLMASLSRENDDEPVDSGGFQKDFQPKQGSYF